MSLWIINSQLFSFYIVFEILRASFFSTSVMLNKGRASKGHRSSARHLPLLACLPRLPVEKAKTYLDDSKNAVAEWESWVSVLPKIHLAFRGDLPAFLGIPKCAVSCAEVGWNSDTAASWSLGASQRKFKDEPVFKQPLHATTLSTWQHESSSYFLPGARHLLPKLPAADGESNDLGMGSKCSLVHLAGAFGDMLTRHSVL